MSITFLLSSYNRGSNLNINHGVATPNSNLGVGFINPWSLMDWLPSKGLAQLTTLRTNTQLMGRPKYLNDRPDGRSNHQPEGLAEE